MSDTACQSGVCEGMGCGADQPGSCTSLEQLCTGDMVAYCRCDGETVYGSSTCPAVRYQHPFSCGEPETWKQLHCGSEAYLQTSAQRGVLAFGSQRCLETTVLFTRNHGVQEAAHRLLASHALTSLARAQAAAAGQAISPPYPSSVVESQARATLVVTRWKGVEAAAALDISEPLVACAALHLTDAVSGSTPAQSSRDSVSDPVSSYS